jgi:hypothetical protein
MTSKTSPEWAAWRTPIVDIWTAIVGRSEDRRAHRRVAWRFIPFLIVCYACAIVDGLNIKAVNCPGSKLRVFDVKEENGALFVRPAG